MDIYSRSSRWKILLAIAALVFLTITLIYSNFLAKKLAEGERDKVELFVNTITKVEEMNDDEDLTFEASIIEKFGKDLPVIFERDNGDLEGWNLDGASDENSENQVRLAKEIEDIKNDGGIPINSLGKAIWYKNSQLYSTLKLFPYLMTLMVILFVCLGYYLFNSARSAEQSRVWAGMAKETAHQLGTPISAIIGWIEVLKDSGEATPDQLEIISELRNDVNRLELVADRFSKIGSAPALDRIDINESLQASMRYMSRRAPKKIVFSLDNSSTSEHAMVNSHLFNWVIENLYRNALDSMDGKGTITTKVYEDSQMVAIDIQDSGSGIPSSKFKTVFQPGFSTKKRGWGLGLSLAKRIIEHYHKGKIFVKNSKIDHGTTFAIRLPKV